MQVQILSWARPEGDSNESPSLFPIRHKWATGGSLRNLRLHSLAPHTHRTTTSLKLQVSPSKLQVRTPSEIPEDLPPELPKVRFVRGKVPPRTTEPAVFMIDPCNGVADRTNRKTRDFRLRSTEVRARWSLLRPQDVLLVYQSADRAKDPYARPLRLISDATQVPVGQLIVVHQFSGISMIEARKPKLVNELRTCAWLSKRRRPDRGATGAADARSRRRLSPRCTSSAPTEFAIHSHYIWPS